MSSSAASLKILISAYACEPLKGSEPGVGWNMALAVARHHDVWVLTRANNRKVIEAALPHDSRVLRFVYYDLPATVRWWKRAPGGVQLYYYLWQLGAYFVARRLHRRLHFDIVHHVTFGKYWVPSFLALLPVPFIWGPVGGGESTPPGFRASLSRRGRIAEVLREMARSVAERDPFVRLTARRSGIALAKTPETAARLMALGAHRVRILSEAGLWPKEVVPSSPCLTDAAHPQRFVSAGQLRDLKGFHLGIRAFAAAGLSDAEYWIIGDGPSRRYLQTLATSLGVAERVRFWGWLTRDETLRRIRESQVLIHPTLHDSGGWVCLEAMAAGRPVICLDLGGPATQVPLHAGVRVPARDPEQVVGDLARAMRRLADDTTLRSSMGRAARAHSRAFLWEYKTLLLDALYREIAHGSRDAPNPSRQIVSAR